VGFLEDNQLDKDYMAWRAKEIEAGRIKKPTPKPFDPSSKEVPFLREADRRTLNQPLSELKQELSGFRKARAAGQPVDYGRSRVVVDEIQRLTNQEDDIAIALQREAEYDDFVRSSHPQKVKPKLRPFKKAANWWKGLSGKKQLAIGAGVVLASTLAFGRKEDHNSIPGMHPYSEGLGTQMLRQHSEFGSGYIGLKGLVLAESQAAFQASKDTIYKEGYKSYQLFDWESKRNARASFESFAKQKENQLKFPAMGDRGTFAAHMRGEITEFKEQFASRWDPFKNIASKLFRQGDSNKALNKLTRTGAFESMITEGKQIKSLGKGRFGEAFLYEGQFRGESFKYVMKQSLPGKEKFLQQEHTALKEIAGDIMPSAYKLSDDSSKLYMEYMPGKTIDAIREAGREAPEGIMGSIRRQAEEVAGKGFKNIDIHEGNIMFDPKTARASWIDFGSAVKQDPRTARAEMKKVIDIREELMMPAEEIAAGESLFAPSGKLKNPFVENVQKIQGGPTEGIKFPAMPDKGLAPTLREQITEFKKDFASRWDPLRKLATKLYGGKSNEAFSKLTSGPAFRSAVQSALTGKGKLLGKGAMGEARAYEAVMNFGGQKHKFDFVAKTTLSKSKGGLSGIVDNKELIEGISKSEAASMEKLGHLRAPSLYGRGKDLGLRDENTIIMEKFNLTTPIAEYKKQTLPGGLEVSKFVKETPLSGDELTDLKSFMKTAHKKGVTHTDMHAENVVRALNPETGKAEIAVLDWGMANRFQQVEGIGGTQSHVISGSAGEVLLGKISKKVGRQVSPREYSESADLLRVEGHMVGVQAPRSSRGAVNSVYQYHDQQMKLFDAEKELVHLRNIEAKPQFIKEAEGVLQQKRIAMRESEILIDEVADNIANHITGGPATKSGMIDDMALGSFGNSTYNVRKSSVTVAKKKDMAYLKTELANNTAKASIKSDNMAATMAAKARKAAVARNNKFEKLTKSTVGVGLRKSREASKGHTGFSTVVR
jgi:tRNA A-37 threonylcarbamoyl transferase component Bud32